MEKPIWLFFVVSKLMTWSIFVSEDVTRTFIWFLVIQFSRFPARVPDALALSQGDSRAPSNPAHCRAYRSATSSILAPALKKVNNFLKIFVKNLTKKKASGREGFRMPWRKKRNAVQVCML
jgi:hypothetical protein